MTKNIVKTLLIALMIAIIIIGGMKIIQAKKAKEAQEPVAKIYPIAVKIINAAPSKAQLTLPYLAQVENDQNVMLSSRMPARVLMIKNSGETVQKGDLLVKLDTDELTAEIGSVKISLSNLMKTHQRTQALYRVKGASIEQLQKEESSIATLKAKLRTLENQMSYATLVSPVSGVITKTFVSKGSIAMAGKPLLAISATKGFSMIVRLPDTIEPKSIIFERKQYPIHSLESTFEGLNGYKAYVDASGLSVGETADIRVVVFEGEATKLPFDAILDRDGKSYVLVVKEDKVVSKEVHILQKGEEGVVIKEALQKEKIVVAKPDILLKLLTGIAVRVKE